MKTILSILIIFIVAGLFLVGGMNLERMKSRPVETIDTVLLKSMGYLRMEKTNAWVHPVKGDIPLTLIVMPAVLKNTNEQIWLLSVTNDMKVGTDVAILDKKSLEKWHEFLGL